MTNEERDNWLSTLKEGDTVYNKNYQYSSLVSVDKYTVKKITSKGSIRLNNDVLLDKNGHKYIDWGSSITIMPMCEEIETAMRKIDTRNLWRVVKSKFESVKLDSLDYDTLKQIESLIDSMN